MIMEIEAFEKLVLKKAEAAGFEDCEIYYQGADSFSIALNETELKQYEKSSSSGAAFRGIINGRTGLAYTERLDEKSAEFIVKSALDNASIAEEGDGGEFYSGGEYPELSLYNEELDSVQTSEKIERLKKAASEAKVYSENIKSADRSVYADERAEVSIMNTRGLNAHYKANSAVAFVSVIAEKDGDIKTGGEFFVGNKFDDFKPEELGRAAAKEADSMLGAKTVKSGVYNVVFKNTAMASILSTFSDSFMGETVYQGLSMLKGMEDKKVAADCVSIRDDALLENGYASAVFDGEGVPCENTAVVENGVLKTFLYDLRYGEKLGKKSTGNGFRYGYKSPVVCACTNFYICPSETEFEDIIKQAGNGIYITDVEGLHAGANPVTGDFSLSAEGFLIEDGKLTTPVEQITAASNFFKLLKGITAVGSDLRFNSDGTGSPAVFAENISISGS